MHKGNEDCNPQKERIEKPGVRMNVLAEAHANRLIVRPGEQGFTTMCNNIGVATAWCMGISLTDESQMKL